jgi:hypothetical protein
VLREGLHHGREVKQTAAEAVHLVNHDAVDLAGLDVAQEAAQGGPLQVAAAPAAVVVALGQTDPALVPLAGDERRGRLALGIERVKLLRQPLLGGLAGVDGATDQGQGCRGAVPGVPLQASPPLPPRRKKRKPLPCEPVICFATALSEV